MAVFYDNPALRDCWFAVATEREAGGGPIARTLLNERLVIYTDPDGEVVAAADRCPHREAPLSAGRLEDGVLVCPYHGWSFGGKGKCVRIPSADPAMPIPRNGHLRCYNTRVRYGLVWVCLGEQPRDLPSIAQDSDKAYRRINNPVEAWRASAVRMTDNFLDIAHFPWVHAGTFGNRQRTFVDKINLEELDDGYYGYRYGVEADNPVGARIVSGQDGETVKRQMSTGFVLPFTVRSTIRYETGLHHVILLLSSPIDDVNSWFTFVVWRNDDFSVPSEEAIAFDRMIGAEDKVMLEQVPGVLPLTPKGVASTRSDTASTAWRLQFARMLGLPATGDEASAAQ